MAETGDDGASGSIDQVREILFGAQQRQLDDRFKKYEQALARASKEGETSLENVRDALQRKLDELQTSLQVGLDGLNERVDDSLGSIRKELTTNAKTVGDRVRDVEKGIRSDLDKFSKQSDKKLDSLRSDLEAAIASLEGDKTGKAELGAYLMEVGMRLTGDPTLDAIKSSLEEPAPARENGSKSKK